QDNLGQVSSFTIVVAGRSCATGRTPQPSHPTVHSGRPFLSRLKRPAPRAVPDRSAAQRRVTTTKSRREHWPRREGRLAGRKVLVTGGARGIGAAIAEALTKAGASVMIGDILADVGKDTAGRLAKAGAKTGFVELNVTDDAQWERAVAAT